MRTELALGTVKYRCLFRLLIFVQQGGSIMLQLIFKFAAVVIIGVQSASVATVKPVRATDSLPKDADDPAIWINRADTSKSLVLGTMKVEAPGGALAVFGLDGKLRQLLKGPDRPNNVDVEYGMTLEATPTDIAVVTEREGRRLRAYAIARDGSALRDVSAGSL